MNASVRLVEPVAERARLWRPSARVHGRLAALVTGVGSLLAWLLLWELASRYEWSFFFRFENIPAPSEVIGSVGELLASPKFVSHVLSSVRRVFVGFVIAALLAVGIGLFIGRFKWVARTLLPPLEVIRPIPAVAWIPIAILLFASPERSMVFITFIGAFFPVLLNTVHGVERLDSRLVHAARSLGASQLHVFREVISPGALPSIVAGLSIGMGTSLFSLVTAEMISAQFGIGYYTWEAYTLEKYPSIVLGMLGIGILGMGSSVLVKVLARAFMPWLAAERAR